MKTYFPRVCHFCVILFTISCAKEESRLPSEPCSNSYKYAYTEKLSYYPGEAMKAFIQSGNDNVLCRLDIYTLSGNLAFSVAGGLNVQTISLNEPAINGFGFTKNVDINIPANVKSGVYLIENQTPFIVKSQKPLDILVVYPSNTANAYDENGGRSLYSTPDSPTRVSFLRPQPLQDNAIQGLKWFESLPNLEVGFIVDADMDDYENFNAKIISIIGHSEYWTRKARKNFDKFIDAGGHAIILSGNTMWWQVRYSADNQLVCYRSVPDPETDPLLRTINWNQSTLHYSIVQSIGADFPHGGFGQQSDEGWDGYKIVAANSPLLDGTGLKKGDIISLSSGEYDGVPIKGFDIGGYPIIDENEANFFKIELIGFDKGSRFGLPTVGTFIVLKKTATSGIIVNGASYDWCSARGMGGRDGDILKKITSNAINKLLNNKTVFSN